MRSTWRWEQRPSWRLPLNPALTTRLAWPLAHSRGLRCRVHPASSRGLTSAISRAFNVAGVAAKLAFTTQPSASNTAGVAFDTQPVVTVQDAFGNKVTSTAAVTLSITPGTGTSSAVLLGTKTVNALNGVATFSGLSINLPGSGYTLTASSSGLT